MIRPACFLRDERGASAAEFALVLPLLLILLFGTIDVGRYAWSLSMAEKATQTGARWAVATDMIADGLITYSFSVSAPNLPQGTPVPQANFPDVECKSNGSTASCTCKGTCSFSTTVGSTGNAAFTKLVNRMAQIYPGLTADKVVVTYSYSGLGFAGDPNGPDVAPLTTVSLQGVKFEPFSSFVFGGKVDLPSFAYTLPMEDGSGTSSN